MLRAARSLVVREAGLINAADGFAGALGYNAARAVSGAAASNQSAAHPMPAEEQTEVRAAPGHDSNRYMPIGTSIPRAWSPWAPCRGHGFG